MKTLPSYLQIAFADLAARGFDAEFDEAFPENGNFRQEERRGVSYWYYRGYQRATDGSKGKAIHRYVGPVSDPEITERVKRFAEIRTSYRDRRQIASTLRAAGLPSPSPLEGNVIAALARGGLFQMRALLIGSLAFQTYPGLLGVQLPDALYRTADIDIAQDYGVSVLIGEDDQMQGVGDVLRSVEPSFRPMGHLHRNPQPAAYRTATGFKVEFLTTNRGSDEIAGDLSDLPSLGVAATPLRYLDFLLREPTRSVLLHDAGVGVMVPAPERYAIHKLIVSQIRNRDGREKSTKDLSQASAIIQAKRQWRTNIDLGFAWIEAWERGTSWRHELLSGAMSLTATDRETLRDGISKAARAEKLRDWEKLALWDPDPA